MNQADWKYHISLPENASEEKKYPVIFAMHGRGSDEQDMMRLLAGLRNRYILVAIQGPLSCGEGYEYFTIKSFGHPNKDSFWEAVEGLENLIGELSLEYPMDCEKQMLLGFSQGAILSMSMAIRGRIPLAGVVALSGYIPRMVSEEMEMENHVKGLPVFIGHGEIDPIFPWEVAKSNKTYFSERGAELTFKGYPMGHQVSQEELNDFTAFIENHL